MIFKRLKAGEKVGDEAFDKALFSADIYDLSNSHFTYIDVAKRAAEFLVDKKGIRVLDIGSGAGKFCMIGATFTEGHFIGVEQRIHLHQMAQKITSEYGLENLQFIHSNINVIDFSLYDAFYFYNPFVENIAPLVKVDDTIVLQHELYKTYNKYVHDQLSHLVIGTRLVTYFSESKVVPDTFVIHEKIESEKLTFWIKQS